MAIRNIRISTDEVLRKTCKPIKEITPNLLTLLDDMADTMYEANGVGLAAPQVGILKRAVVIDIGEGLVELLNPVILETSGSQTDEAKAMDREGNEFIIEGEELMARALCHEIDHLDGILYIDKALPREEA